MVLLALVFFVGAPILAVLTGSPALGRLASCAGVMLFEVRTLLEGRDRAVGWTLIAVGALVTVADLLRLLLLAGSGG